MDQLEFDLDEFTGEWMNEEIRRSRRRSRPPRRRLRPAARIIRKPGLAAPTRRLPARRLRQPGKYPRPILPLPYPRPGGRPHVDIKIETPAEPAASGGAPAPFEPSEPPPPQGSEFLRWVQATLNQVLNLRLPVDGIAGLETRRAIRSFQQRMGLPGDGIVGPETRQALVKARQEAAASAPQGELMELEIDRRSRDYIRWVQTALNRIMRAGLSVDGISGPRTRQAVIAFQRSRSLTPDGIVGPITERALQAAGAPAPPQSSSQPSAGLPPQAPSLSGIRRNIVQIALQELRRWGNGRIKESNRTLRPVLESYWRTGVGWLPSKPNWWSSVPWSAAFISWVMRQAGAGPAFRYAGGHSYYIAAAKQNRLSNSSNPFQAYRINEVSPQEGDIVCKSRAGSGATYDNIRGGMPTHCDIVVARQPGKLLTVGGNVSDSVKITEVPIDAAGRIRAPRYFAVIKTGA